MARVEQDLSDGGNCAGEKEKRRFSSRLLDSSGRQTPPSNSPNKRVTQELLCAS